MAYTKALTAIAAMCVASAATATSPDPTTGPAPGDSAWTRYCMKVEPITGSRVETVECWTRAEWTEQGVDLDKDWAKEGVSIIA